MCRQGRHKEGDSANKITAYWPLGRLQCSVCLGPVCPRSSQCADCSFWSYACPETGLCIDPGAWAWLKCGTSRPGFRPGFTKTARGAAKEDVSWLAFVAYRIRSGLLDEDLAEGE